MSTSLYLAPAAAGKTAYVLALARDLARELGETPRVVVATVEQRSSVRRRLAEAGGAMGVRVLTFDALYAECLTEAGASYSRLPEAVEHRLLRAILADLPLAHYAPLVDRPGFVALLRELASDLKSARIMPDAFERGVAIIGSEPRLAEIASIYAAYQDRLREQGWADRAGVGWMAVEAVGGSVDVARDWPLVAVDGFDSFTQLQTDLLAALAGRVGRLVVTLTGDAECADCRRAHARFDRTRRRLEEALAVDAAPLPSAEEARGDAVSTAPAAGRPPASRPATASAPSALRHLQADLFTSRAARSQAGGAVSLVAAPDQAAEARFAMRWLKARLVVDGLRPSQVALLARSIHPYRPYILECAAEFGLPVSLADGMPLRSSPAVAAILDLAHAVLPLSADDERPALPRPMIVEAVRSPYFDWENVRAGADGHAVGLTSSHADALDAVARWGQVIGGADQWHEAFDLLSGRETSAQGGGDDEVEAAVGIPTGADARDLRARFDRLVSRLSVPPAGSYRGFAAWLEGLIGADPASPEAWRESPDATSLRVAENASAPVSGAPQVAEHDLVALEALKDVLRGLVWAEEAVPPRGAVTFSRFVQDLEGAIEATSIRAPTPSAAEKVLVADAAQARGLALRAVAVMGLAEGEFPTTLAEDVLLRDADRRRLRAECGLALDPSTESFEMELFYEATCRATEKLLVTRPRLADNGADWPPSPFWDEVLRHVDAPVELLATAGSPAVASVASVPELIETAAARAADGPAATWLSANDAERWERVRRSADIFRVRYARRPDSPFDGQLGELAGPLRVAFGHAARWSASRLEAYRACPHWFFVDHVLCVAPRAVPQLGFDAAQLGTIYHSILELLYARSRDPRASHALGSMVEEVAAPILDGAPRTLGFRETAWWAQTREEIVENVRRTAEAMAHLPGDFVPIAFEAHFFDDAALRLVDGDDSFTLRGIIDRVDRDQGGSLRIIDYKTAGPYAFTPAAVRDGKKLQLPLYALAARDALGLGEPKDGFYWHVQQATPSPFTLAGYEGGPDAAMADAARHAWSAVRGARDGHFVPRPPPDGCPDYCAAAGFCWRYRAPWGRS